MTPRMLHRAALAAALAVLVSAPRADAQTPGGTTGGTTGGTGGRTLRPFPKATAPGGTSTGTGGSTATSGSTGGGTGTSSGMGSRTGGRGFGFGQRATLSQEQELAVLLDTLNTVEALLDSGEFQVSSELEVLMLLVVVYETKRAEALALTQGGTGSGTTTSP